MFFSWRSTERHAFPVENACRSIERHAFSAGIACRSIERHAFSGMFGLTAARLRWTRKKRRSFYGTTVEISWNRTSFYRTTRVSSWSSPGRSVPAVLMLPLRPENAYRSPDATHAERKGTKWCSQILCMLLWLHRVLHGGPSLLLCHPQAIHILTQRMLNERIWNDASRSNAYFYNYTVFVCMEVLLFCCVIRKPSTS